MIWGYPYFWKHPYIVGDVGGYQQPLKGSLFHYPKKVTIAELAGEALKRSARAAYTILHPWKITVTWNPKNGGLEDDSPFQLV